MKKIGIINGPISAAIASLGHGQTLAVVDAGFPIPPTPERIDLALTDGIPTFLDALEVVLSEMFIEKAIFAEEMLSVSPERYEEAKKLVGDVPIETFPHEEFKKMSEGSRAVVRTADHTPFSNVILVSGPWGFYD